MVVVTSWERIFLPQGRHSDLASDAHTSVGSSLGPECGVRKGWSRELLSLVRLSYHFHWSDYEETCRSSRELELKGKFIGAKKLEIRVLVESSKNSRKLLEQVFGPIVRMSIWNPHSLSECLDGVLALLQTQLPADVHSTVMDLVLRSSPPLWETWVDSLAPGSCLL